MRFKSQRPQVKIQLPLFTNLQMAKKRHFELRFLQTQGKRHLLTFKYGMLTFNPIKPTVSCLIHEASKLST